MAKVLRIYNGGKDGEHWFDSSKISDEQIDAIEVQNTEGRSFPTSIPNPFARIDLVNNAYNVVGENSSLETVGTTDNHFLISDALDIAQLFFRFRDFKDKLSISEIIPDQALRSLKESGDSRHVAFGKTMELYFDDSLDGNYFRMNEFNAFYVLKYNNQVIGATSPLTLFFASSRADKWRSRGGLSDIIFGTDIPLDEVPRALRERDRSFVDYIFYLRNTHPSLFSNMESYLSKTLEEIREIDHDNARANFLDGVQELPAGLQPLRTGYSTGAKVTNAGVELYCLGIPERKTSDFEIKVLNPEITVENPPLILPCQDDLNSRFSENFIYWNEQWNHEWKGERFNTNYHKPESILPYVNFNCDWLGIDNILLDEIIDVGYELDRNVVHSIGGGKNFIPPIHPLVLEYFSPEEVINMIEIDEFPGDVLELTMKIPVRGGEIHFRKKYMLEHANTTSPEVGRIKKLKIACAINALNRGIEDNEELEFTGLFFYTYFTQSNVKIKPIEKKAGTADGELIRYESNNRSVNQNVETWVLRYERFPDAFVISTSDELKGLLLPKWKKEGRNHTGYKFAIDLGTTNTHIEYLQQGQGADSIRSLDFSIGDPLLYGFRAQGEEAEIAIEELEDYINHSSYPEVLNSVLPGGEGRHYPFPTRTCLLEDQNINYSNYSTKSFAFLKSSIGFDYQRKDIKGFLQAKTNLKWDGADSNSVNRLKLYIVQLVYLCWKKVLEEGGNLNELSIIWFYPSSMSNFQVKKFTETWKEAYKEVVGTDPKDKVVSMLESLAPMYYYQAVSGHAIAEGTRAASIDIGGGTTDIVITDGTIPDISTSCRYAGEALFGNGFNGTYQKNGFVRDSLIELKSLLRENELSKLSGSLEQVESKSDSVEVINFLFSLEHAEEIVRKDLSNISLSRILADRSELKLSLVVFIASLFKHISDMSQTLNNDFPKYIYFSGNGSRILHVIDPDDSKGAIAKLAELIWQQDAGNEGAHAIKIEIQKNPKEATSKGGLQAKKDVKDPVKKVVYAKQEDSDKSLQEILLDSDLVKSIAEDCVLFLKSFKSLDSKFSFHDNLGISREAMTTFFGLVEEFESNGDFVIWTKQGLEKMISENGGESAVVESPFFYPLRGFLYQLSSRLSNIEA